jgi:eukaryotic-like serine/threonine-protein kinase
MIFEFEEFELDARRLELRRAGNVVEADTLVLRVLSVLVRNAGRLVTKEELVQEVWDGRVVADNVITVSMARLRKALDDKRGDREMVKTVYGRGYRFVRSVREVQEPQRSHAARHEQAAPPFVGRERLLSRLEAALGEAQHGRGRVCALLGEAGIGKTQMVETFCRDLPPSCVVSWGFCREAGDTPPLAPWLRILRELLDGPMGEQLATLGEDYELARGLLRAPRDERSAAFSPDPFFEQQVRYRSYEAILRVLARATESTPLVLVFEDLHRADAATLELLGLLLEEVGLMRILVLATLRHGDARDVVRSRLARVLGHRNCERIAVPRLRESDVHAYVTGLLGEGAASIARSVFAKSEGNPFFMAELCRQLRDRDPGERDVLALPDAALELVRQHLARLDEEARGVLSAAAVIGRSFELWLLHATTGREMGALMASLDAALAAEVLVAAPDSTTAFAFGHELMRSVLYEGLSPAERRSWHVRVADALHQRVESGESIPPSEIAYHLHTALPDARPETTVHYCRLAAAAAASSFTNDDVVRYVRHALEALDLLDKPSLRLRMHLLYLKAMYARGDSFAEYEAASRELARLARTSDDGQMLVRAAIMYNLHPGFRQLSGASAELTTALELLPPDDLAMRAVALGGLAMDTPNCYSQQRSDELLAEAVPLARESTSRASLYVVLIAALQLRGGPKHEAEASEIVEELALLAQQNPTRMPVLPIDISLYRAVTALQRGDLAAATRAAESGAATARRLHHGELLWHTERTLAKLSLLSGNVAGVAQLARLQERAMHPGLLGVAPFAAADKAMWFSETGTRVELEESERAALGYDASDPPALWALKLRALAAVGLREEARTSLRALAPGELAKLPCDRDFLGTIGHVLHAALLIGASEYAEHAASLLTPYRDRYCVHIGFMCEGSVPHLLGSAALARGDIELAVRELEEGVSRNEQAGLALCTSYARLTLGRALLCRNQAQDRARAEQLLSEVAAQARRLGMVRLAQAASKRGQNGASLER